MKDTVISIRTKHRLKMPDAFVAATAIYFKLPLYTFDQGFLKINSLNILLPR